MTDWRTNVYTNKNRNFDDEYKITHLLNNKVT